MCPNPPGGPNDQGSEIADRTEEKSHDEKRNDDKMRHSFTLRLPSDPRADHQVERQVVEPPCQECPPGLKQGVDIVKGTESPLAATPPDADQGRVGDRKKGRHDDRRRGLSHSSPPRHEDQQAPTRHRDEVAARKQKVDHDLIPSQMRIRPFTASSRLNPGIGLFSAIRPQNRHNRSSFPKLTDERLSESFPRGSHGCLAGDREVTCSGC